MKKNEDAINFLSKMKLINSAVLASFLCIGQMVHSQSTVSFSDQFGTNTNAAYVTTGVISGTNWNVVRSGLDWGARRNPTNTSFELTNDASTSTNNSGWVFGYLSNSLSCLNPILSANQGTTSWVFNMRQIRTDPAGFLTGSYGVAFVLAGSSINVNNNGTGYAIVLGNSGTADPLRLVAYSGGLAGTLTTIVSSNTAGLTDFGNEYLSIKVTYNATGNAWQLFVRNDGLTGFSDPNTGVLTSQGTGFNSSYTSSTLSLTGAYWQGSTTANQLATFDNISIERSGYSNPTAPNVSNVTANCGQSVTLTATGSSGVYNWYSDVSGSAYLGTGSTYAIPAVYGSTTIYAKGISAGCLSAPGSGLVTMNAVAAPIVSSTSIACGSSTTLTASGGLNYNWYSDANCTNLISTSASYTTPNLNNTTTYYVKSHSGTFSGSQNFSFTGGVQTFTVPQGVTSINVTAFGAQGGGNGGLGGQATATIPVTPGEVLNVYVGGKPTVQLGAGGFNGGGAVLTLPCGGGTSDGWPGGGATDIRRGSTLNDRLIVAGGGGGGGYTNGLGGAGGGTTGGNGAASFVGGSNGLGGTQVAGGLGGLYNGVYAQSGALGVGGNASPASGLCTGGGGGGGYYGGGGGYTSAAGGGSSYVSYSGNTSTSTVAGVNSGNGSISITWSGIYCASSPTAVTVTVNAPVLTVNAPAPMCSGSTTLTASGGSGTYTWYSDANGTVQVGTGATFTTPTLTNTTTYYVKSGGSVSSSQTFDYTGGVQTFTVPTGVTSINVAAYGAQGGGNGGLGGQANASIPVTPGEVLNIYVGGRPLTQMGAGGYNGGGAVLTLPCGGGTSDGWPGGGASDIRRGSAYSDRLLVAGGGGGGGYSNGLGGQGGGTTGGNGAASFVGGSNGLGGTQSAGGLGGLYNGVYAQSGALGVGGNASPASGLCTGGGGGGGYYGGGGGYTSAAGGGSSFVAYAGNTGTSTLAGVRSGHGQVVVSWTLSTCLSALTPVTVTITPSNTAPVLTGTNTVCVATPVTINAGGGSASPTSNIYWYTGPNGTGSFLGTGSSYTVSPTATTTYYARREGGCNTTADGSFSITVNTPTVNATPLNGDAIWRGAVSTDYTNASNWYLYNGSSMVQATVSPTTTTNVIIPVNQTCVQQQPAVLIGGSVDAKNVLIESGATLSLGSGTLNVHGNYTNNGTLNAGTGTVAFIGASGNQTITKTGGETFPFLIVNKASGNVILANDVTVSGGLTLTNGLVEVGTNNMIMGASTLTGGSSASYVKTASTGILSRNVGASATTFPVGNSTYNPAMVTNAGTADIFTLRVIDNVTADGTGVGTPTTDAVVNRTWMVNETTTGGSDVTLRLYWNGASEEVNGFSAASAFIAHYISSASMWDNIGFSGQGAGYFETNNISSFSPFTISSTATASSLPIELVSFQANCAGVDKISVSWTTASEHNTSHFLVDRSKDGLNWMKLIEIAAAGNSTQLLTYNVMDTEKSFETNYYRLTQFDNNGDFKMFEPVSVNCYNPLPKNHITSYPNPSENDFYLSLYTETLEGLSKLNITDASGRSIYNMDVYIEQGNNIYFIEDFDAAPGIYYIQVSNGTASTDIVKHSLR